MHRIYALKQNCGQEGDLKVSSVQLPRAHVDTEAS